MKKYVLLPLEVVAFPRVAAKINAMDCSVDGRSLLSACKAVNTCSDKMSDSAKAFQYKIFSGGDVDINRPSQFVCDATSGLPLVGNIFANLPVVASYISLPIHNTSISALAPLYALMYS
jgi:hypothetical protein